MKKQPKTQTRNPKPTDAAVRITNSLKRGQIHVIGIGASAGGLEALEQFFQNMPGNTGLAVVVIQHLDPNHTGMLPELLQRTTPMKVFQVTDGIKVKPNCVYVIPPAKSMSLLRGSLHLFDPVETRGLRLPVDIFFRSLADDQGEKSIGLILSGMGSDGSQGLKAIKAKNGMVLVQDPVSAKFDGMPRSAIDAVAADIIAPANELPGKLISFLKLNAPPNPPPDLDGKIKSSIDKIIILLREQTGHDVSLYKKSTLFRRIERRKSAHEMALPASFAMLPYGKNSETRFSLSFSTIFPTDMRCVHGFRLAQPAKKHLHWPLRLKRHWKRSNIAKT